MATEAQKRELISKMTAYVRQTYGGSDVVAWKKAFDAADKDKTGRITEKELYELLKKADVGNVITRGAWTAGVLDYVGHNDGSITFDELLTVINPKRSKPAPVVPPQPTQAPMPTNLAEIHDVGAGVRDAIARYGMNAAPQPASPPYGMALALCGVALLLLSNKKAR